ncbi:MAG: ATP-binding cassette domain-containing protein, partial [Candidatus Aminicenantes bacterium]|nr:ATP-binding cassette domain-containing protein [Candidatus Aminicenantes bacterium]
MKTLEGKGMSMSFKKRRVVNNISIKVCSGEVIGLLGPNGAGKTTTFHMILGIHRPESGEILLNNINITKYPVYMRARSGIGFLPQEPSVFRGMSVIDNIYAVLEHRKEKKEVKIEEVLDEMGLSDLRNRKAS